MELISRMEARSKGLKRFCTGKVCKHGHVAERYVSNGKCVECQIKDSDALYGGKRPNNGTTGHEIWNALDKMFATGEPPTRKRVVQLASEMGWNEGNAATELNFWRKYRGLTKKRLA